MFGQTYYKLAEESTQILGPPNSLMELAIIPAPMHSFVGNMTSITKRTQGSNSDELSETKTVANR